MKSNPFPMEEGQFQFNYSVASSPLNHFVGWIEEEEEALTISLVIHIRTQLPNHSERPPRPGPGHAARFNKSGLIIKWNGNG